MEPVDRHAFAPDLSFDGGDLDCGNGLLLLIRQHMDRLKRGQLLEFRSTEISVEERLAVDAQLRAGVEVVTDGEQRRDNYASFVGARLDNCQLIPLTHLLPLVDDPETFEAEMRSLDVPASEVRHPAVFGPLGRSRPLAVHELDFVQTLTDRPVKVALPGPYLLTRIMWMEWLCTPRAGELEVLRDLPADRRIAVGVVNPKHERVEAVEEIVARAGRAVALFGPERVLLTPDCGFATFADNPVASPRIAEAKLRAIAQAADILRRG